MFYLIPTASDRKLMHFALSGCVGLIIVIALGFIVLTPFNPLLGLNQTAYRFFVPPFSQSFVSVMRAVTEMGNSPFVTLLSLIAVCILLIRRHVADAAAWAVGIWSAETLTEVFKQSFPLSRPVSKLVEAAGSAYPSGHSAAAAALATLAILCLVPHVKSRPARIIISTLCVLLALCVMLSRVALGVHWVSDVLAGALTGASAALLSYAIIHW